MKKRNQTVDLMRLISAFFIIFLHFKFPGYLGNFIFVIARFAVPFFFTVSGYYYCKEDKTAQYKSTKHKIKHIFSLLVVSEVLGFVYKLATDYTFRLSPIHNIKEVLIGSFADYGANKWRAVSFTLLFNEGSWFLTQLIVIYAVFALITKYNLFKVSKYIALFGFIAGYAIIRICSIFDVGLPPYSDYFILFMGFPFFSFGYYLNYYSYKPKIKSLIFILLILVGAVLSVVESALFNTAHCFFGSVVILFSVASLFIRYADFHFKTKFGELLSFLGQKTSLYIYILHPFFGGYIVFAVKKILGENIFLDYTMPLIVCVAVTVISFLAFEVNYFIAKRIKKR